MMRMRDISPLCSFCHVRNIICTSACALGPLVTCQGPGAHKHRHVALKMLRAFGQPVQHMSQFLLTSYFQRSHVIFMTIAPLIVNLLFRSSNYIVLSKNSCLFSISQFWSRIMSEKDYVNL